ncbi:MAG: hypothetical protein MI919_36505, partial [Holophagales bacterium]|nr:hypothetical protein [Holophagales bacterium]
MPGTAASAEFEHLDAQAPIPGSIQRHDSLSASSETASSPEMRPTTAPSPAPRRRGMIEATPVESPAPETLPLETSPRPTLSTEPLPLEARPALGRAFERSGTGQSEPPQPMPSSADEEPAADTFETAADADRAAPSATGTRFDPTTSRASRPSEVPASESGIEASESGREKGESDAASQPDGRSRSAARQLDGPTTDALPDRQSDAPTSRRDRRRGEGRGPSRSRDRGRGRTRVDGLLPGIPTSYLARPDPSSASAVLESFEDGAARDYRAPPPELPEPALEPEPTDAGMASNLPDDTPGPFDLLVGDVIDELYGPEEIAAFEAFYAEPRAPQPEASLPAEAPLAVELRNGDRRDSERRDGERHLEDPSGSPRRGRTHDRSGVAEERPAAATDARQRITPSLPSETVAAARSAPPAGQVGASAAPPSAFPAKSFPSRSFEVPPTAVESALPPAVPGGPIPAIPIDDGAEAVAPETAGSEAVAPAMAAPFEVPLISDETMLPPMAPGSPIPAMPIDDGAETAAPTTADSTVTAAAMAPTPSAPSPRRSRSGPAMLTATTSPDPMTTATTSPDSMPPDSMLTGSMPTHAATPESVSPGTGRDVPHSRSPMPARPAAERPSLELAPPDELPPGVEMPGELLLSDAAPSDRAAIEALARHG